MRNARETVGVRWLVAAIGAWMLSSVALVAGEGGAAANAGKSFESRANTPPRKVVVASAQLRFSGSVEERLTRLR